ncbi:AsmA family protein [Chitinophaga costaii]|uniref:AsmA family protein n=1 Tax=Chitinophaga costaii TaxID=1335309 RepID=A0A1C3Z8U9_9BACT|nr:AsmA-like C-terminal region-containing protein [Chitinophaga costaii]PUZ30279.1 AsmA family protein [Chitinophaga costaii]SCB78824.1 AsmA family protein [Chitinophaga costaii]
MFKRIFKIVLVFLLVLIVAAIAIPFLFKDKILAKVKTELNDHLNAQVDFKDIDISLFRHFPRLAVGLEDLQVINVAPFAGDTLLSVKKIDVALDLMSVIRGSKMDIYNISLETPRIHTIIDSTGKANWDITKPDTAQSQTAADTSKSTFDLRLQQYSITNAYLSYDDHQGHMSLIIDGLNHSGKGDFTQDKFVLTTTTQANAVTFYYGLIPYLDAVKTTLDADIQIDNLTSTYTIPASKIHLNNLEVAVNGLFKMLPNSAYGMDFTFKSASTQFKDLLSLIPVIYAKDFDKIKTSGTANFNGFVKGTYSDKQLPVFGLNLGVKNGFFQYPDLPKPVQNIQLALSIASPDGVPDHTVIDLSQAHLEMDATPLDLRLHVATPVSDMYVEGAAKGKLDLSKISQFIKLDNGTQLNGLLDADMSAKGHLSAIERKAYDEFYAAGSLAIHNMLYKSKDFPDGIKLNALALTFNPKNVSVPTLDAEYLGSHFTGSGEINNMLAYVFKNQALNGQLKINADKINLDKFMASTATANTTESKPATTTDSAHAIPFAVPANLDLTLQAAAGTVHYDKLDMTNVSGILLVKDQTITLENVKSNALQGTLGMSGSYSTKASKISPDMHFTYDVEKVDIKQTFDAFNTVQKLMPIGQFLTGKISSQLSVDGKLGKDMMPVMNSLNGNGSLLLIEGVLQKFAPLDQLSSTLNITQLKDISLRDIKTYFAFQDGRVVVKPFNVVTSGVRLQIAGSHGLDQSIDYTIQMALPRTMLGSQGNALVNNLVSQANNKGIPVKLSDSVHLNIAMGGSMTKPALQTNLKESANSLTSQATALVQGKVDSAKATIKDSVNAVKNQAVTTAKDALKQQLLGSKDTTAHKPTNAQDAGKQAGQTIKNTLGGLLKKKGN